MEADMLHNRPTTAQSIGMVPMRPNFRSQSQLSSATVKYASMLFCAFAVGLTALPASAEELTHDQMVCALDPQCVIPLVNRRLRGIADSSARITRGSFDRTINFAFDSAELTPLARSELDQVAAVLKEPHVDKYTIIIHGHTDDVGTVEYNQGLSERRAEAARQCSSFADGAAIPRRLTCDGEDLSPPLSWSDAPTDTRSFVLLCDDPDAPAGKARFIVLTWSIRNRRSGPGIRSSPGSACRCGRLSDNSAVSGLNE
jgi:hypothetical protein